MSLIAWTLRFLFHSATMDGIVRGLIGEGGGLRRIRRLRRMREYGYGKSARGHCTVH